MPEAVLNVSNISHFYRAASGFWGRRSVRALDDVSLKIHRGEIVGIVGESGSGKTTISKIMMGLLTPTSGTVELDGRSISEQSRRDIARRIQFVFQDPYASLNPRQSIGRIISQPLKVHGIGTWVEHAKAAREALIGLPEANLGQVPAAGGTQGGDEGRGIAQVLVRPDDAQRHVGPRRRRHLGLDDGGAAIDRGIVQQQDLDRVRDGLGQHRPDGAPDEDGLVVAEHEDADDGTVGGLGWGHVWQSGFLVRV